MRIGGSSGRALDAGAAHEERERQNERKPAEPVRRGIYMMSFGSAIGARRRPRGRGW